MILLLMMIFIYNIKDIIHERNLDMLDFIKIKIFYHAKDTGRKVKRQATGKKEIFTKVISNKGPFSKIYNINLNSKETTY